MVKNFYEELKKLKTLSPNKETNKFFTNLVNFSIENNKPIEYNEIVSEINKSCSIGEYELEKFSTEDIIRSKNPLEEIKNFTYYKNYYDLIKFEYQSSMIFLDKIENVLFIGGGPLPMSSIILALEYKIKSKIIDLDEEAINLSKKLIKKLNLEKYISIENGNAKNYQDKNQYDLCYIASLVFSFENHNEILENIKKINFKLLLTRTIHSTRQLLYKKVDEEILRKHFNIQLISHPKNKVVNSIILSYKK